MSRHQRNIEEVFHAIAPAGRRGIPAAPPIAVGVTGSGGADSAASMSQASQEISLLESQFKQQAALIQANTQALQSNTTAHAGQSVGGAIGSAAQGLMGGGLGLLSPVISGIASLFGLGSPAPAPALPFYVAPPSVQMSDTLRAATPTPVASTGMQSAATPVVASTGMQNAVAPVAASTGMQSAAAPVAANPGMQSAAPQVTVHVSAMDSQSFMDRSTDIANAVREAMLNLHPINAVVASL